MTRFNGGILRNAGEREGKVEGKQKECERAKGLPGALFIEEVGELGDKNGAAGFASALQGRMAGR